MFRVFRHALLHPRQWLRLAGMLALSTVLTMPAHANSGTTGLWSATDSLGFVALHLVLLPGDGSTYHSRILTWDELGNGKEIGWTLDNDACGDWSGSFTRFTHPWVPGTKLFCAGHTGLAAGGGRILTVGGDEDFLGNSAHGWGISDARMYTPGSGSATGTWDSLGPMRQERFYPTATTLRDGRVFVTGGSRSPQLWFFGGRRDGSPPPTSPSGDSLYRIGLAGDAQWHFANRPEEDPEDGPPAPREGHTAVLNSELGAQVIYGGKDGAGVSIDDPGVLWLLQRADGSPLGSDYEYQWTKFTPGGSSFPSRRSDHVAIANATRTEMLVFGGLNQPSSGGATPLGDVWRLFKNSENQWQWAQLTPSGGPGPRYGHASVWDAAENRMIVFGGSGTAGADPSNAAVWELRFTGGTFASGSWGSGPLPVQSGGSYQRPLPRRDHTMVLDMNSPSGGRSLVLFSGYINSSTASDTIWTLNLGAGTLAWSPLTVSGTKPAPRQGHAAFYDASFGNGRMSIFGGDPTSADTVAGYVYSIDPFLTSGTPTWMRRAYGGLRLSGQSIGADHVEDLTYARNPEIHNPSTGTLNRAGIPGGSIP